MNVGGYWNISFWVLKDVLNIQYTGKSIITVTSIAIIV
jgi:hypothetical protein